MLFSERMRSNSFQFVFEIDEPQACPAYVATVKFFDFSGTGLFSLKIEYSIPLTRMHLEITALMCAPKVRPFWTPRYLSWDDHGKDRLCSLTFGRVAVSYLLNIADGKKSCRGQELLYSCCHCVSTTGQYIGSPKWTYLFPMYPAFCFYLMNGRWPMCLFRAWVYDKLSDLVWNFIFCMCVVSYRLLIINKLASHRNL